MENDSERDSDCDNDSDIVILGPQVKPHLNCE